MDSEHRRKKRTNVEEVDRLSSLPDDLIHKILSFIGITDAIGTSTLSSRWRYIWTSMSCLKFSSEDFANLPKFSKFVTQFLSRRNNQIGVSSLDLSFRGKVTQPFVKKLLDYAYSHNIQQLNVSYTPKHFIEFPLSLFSSQSLKHLSVTLGYGYKVKYLPTTSTLELPALTTLYLHGLTLCCDNNSDSCIALFSKCPNLKNLTLSSCRTKEGNNFSICHPQLSNLTLDDGPSVKVVNVVAPQLENLIIRYRYYSNNRKYVISAPNLISLVYQGYLSLHLSTDGFHSLKEADICVFYPNDDDAHQMVCLLQQLHNVKFLKLNLEIVEILSSSLGPILNQPSPFANLESLKIYPTEQLSEEEERKRVKMSNEVKNYLLDNSASATFTMVTREEIRAKKNTELAKNLMEKLRVLLEEEKAKTKTNRADMEQTKTQGENQLQIGGRVKHVDRCWEDLSLQIEQGREKTSDIISELRVIKELLKKLPTSKREELQTCFSSLCAEANMVVKNILDDMKIQCDMKERHFSVYFRELAQTSESSS